MYEKVVMSVKFEQGQVVPIRFEKFLKSTLAPNLSPDLYGHRETSSSILFQTAVKKRIEASRP